MLLTERYKDKIKGVLSCYERIAHDNGLEILIKSNMALNHKQ